MRPLEKSFRCLWGEDRITFVMKYKLYKVTVILLLTFWSVAISSSLDGETIDKLESSGQYRNAFELCAKDNSAKSLCIQGDYLYHGRKGIPADRARGQELYKRALGKLLSAAEGGDVDAQYWLGRCQEYGMHDLKEARKWYRIL